MKHEHRFLPSKGCTWKCACGDSFTACLCGRCQPLTPPLVEQQVDENSTINVVLQVPDEPPQVVVTVRGVKRRPQ